MGKVNTENFKAFEAFIASTNGTYVFNDVTSVQGVGLLLKVIQDMGLDPMKTEDLKKGLMFLFNIEFINIPDLENSRFIFTPNHVSDLDAIILGLLHPRIKVVAKRAWTDNDKLKPYLGIHYDLYGFDRTSLPGMRRLLADAIRYFQDDDENKHFLVFSQGTISDFNNNSSERVSSIAQIVSDKTNVPIVNMFVEQASLYHPTRIVFDEPMKLSKQDDFRKIWLEREIAMQNALVPAARRPKLSDKHANNNKPGDPFF